MKGQETETRQENKTQQEHQLLWAKVSQLHQLEGGDSDPPGGMLHANPLNRSHDSNSD